jgi:type II secretory ATPase GspE/PulE/Tfp pilus assembly ATPase PilB-like protein
MAASDHGKRELEDRLHVLQSESEERLSRHRAESLGLPYISLLTYPINPEEIERVPRAVAEVAQAVLFYKQGRDVRVAAVNPKDPAVATLVQELKTKFGVEPQVYVTSARSLQAALARYRVHKDVAVTADEMQVSLSDTKKYVGAVGKLEELGQRITTLSPSEMLSAIAAGAVAVGASDIHVEPGDTDARLRYRIDGVLHDITTFARDGWKLLLSRIKVLAKLKLNVTELPQDGSFVLRLPSATFDVRVSTLPGGQGENIVMRLLNREMKAVAVTDLGMKPRDFMLLQEELKRDHGMILVTGPTGSGKTTTLAAAIMTINNPEFKIITLEDPIEYRLPGVEQTQIDPAAGYTFARGLRSILRQDPDVILVGEMRDVETAEVAMHAALTGHLVFSTLHTNNAPGTITRLIDMGVKPFIIAPAVNLVIAQRLVRVVCPQCAEDYVPEEAVRRRLIEVLSGTPAAYVDPKQLRSKKLTLKRAKGCSECNQTGYRGRTGVFEVFQVTGKIEELILQGATAGPVREAAQRAGMTTIVQDAYLKVLAQITTTEEVERVTAE